MALLALTLTLCAAQVEGNLYDPQENYGKSASQVVAMGFDKWYEFFVDKAGSETTLSMSGASYSFGCALHDVNNSRLGSLPAERSRIIQSLRPHMVKFRDDGVLVGMGLSGGGSLWTVIGAATLMDVEETVEFLIRHDEKKPKSRTQADVWKMLSEIEKKIEVGKSELDESGEFTGLGYAKTLGNYKDMQFEFAEAVKTIALFHSAQEKGRIFAEFFDAADTALAAEY